MLPDVIMELIYYVTNKPYFKVFVISNGRRVKKFIQLADSKQKGEDFFLISKSLKCSWWKPSYPVIDGQKFLTFVDLNNAIPLKFEQVIEYEDTEYFVKETKKINISEDVEKQFKNKKNGKPLELVEISFPPTLLFQKVEAHFVKEILSLPPDKWEQLKWVFIAGIIVVGFVAWQLMSSGTLQKIGG